ncbi:MAG: hypothetical protein U5N26_08145 [Candidatus Marinimicrobia bacterium]|nr:hypothetical protein [Candidatus Neomarinimicrobiota bacterium]
MDAFFGVDEIGAVARYLLHRDAVPAPRSLMTPGHYAYLKISEGCDHRCAYCAIPLIREAAQRPAGDDPEGSGSIGGAGGSGTYPDRSGQHRVRDRPGRNVRPSATSSVPDDMEAFEWIRLHTPTCAFLICLDRSVQQEPEHASVYRYSRTAYQQQGAPRHGTGRDGILSAG